MKIKISNIELDESTQCRAEMRQEILDEYTQSMIDGDEFPAIEVYGTKDKCWIADGWHRVLAARQAAKEYIEANLHHGGRAEAVKHALQANAVHGVRRTNADKRRAVEVALQEFGNLSSRAIADMCGVSNRFVSNMRPETGVNGSHLTGQDGKTYPSTKPENRSKEADHEIDNSQQEGTTPRLEYNYEPDETKTISEEEYRENASMALKYADMAIMQLERISADDPKRNDALQKVREYINITLKG